MQKFFREKLQKCFDIRIIFHSETFHEIFLQSFVKTCKKCFSNIAEFLQNLYEMFLKYCRSLSQSICIIRQLAMKYFSKISWNICGTFLETFYEMFLKYCRIISKRIVHFSPLRKIHRNLPWKFSGWSKCLDKFLAESFQERF